MEATTAPPAPETTVAMKRTHEQQAYGDLGRLRREHRATLDAVAQLRETMASAMLAGKAYPQDLDEQLAGAMRREGVAAQAITVAEQRVRDAKERDRSEYELARRAQMKALVDTMVAAATTMQTALRGLVEPMQKLEAAEVALLRFAPGAAVLTPEGWRVDEAMARIRDRTLWERLGDAFSGKLLLDVQARQDAQQLVEMFDLRMAQERAKAQPQLQEV